MTRFFKILGKILGLLLILYILLMILLLVLVKIKDFTPIVTKLFYEETGQVLRIDGNLSLSIFPWPAVEASNIIIENPKQFKAPASIKYLVKIGKVRVRLKILDLFHGNVYPTNIALNRMDLNLVTLRSGETNWSAFIKPKPKKANKATLPRTDKTDSTPSSPQILNASKFPVIQVSDSSVHIVNLQTNSRTDITNLSLNSPSSAKPFERQVTFSAQIAHDDPKTVLGLRLTTGVLFDPAQALITLKNISCSVKWFQVEHKLPRPIVLMMRGEARIHEADFQTLLHGNFGEREGNILLKLSRKQDRIFTSLQLKNVYVSPIAEILTGKDWIDGVINASTDLGTQGKTFESWIRNLSGKGRFTVTGGNIKGLDMHFMLINTINQLLSQNQQKLSTNKKMSTIFDNISADYQISGGQLTSNNFLLDSKTIRATGKGRVNLPDATIDATLIATYKKNPNWKVPLRVTGSLFKPKVQPDTTAIVGELLKKNVQKGLGKTLDNISKQLKGLFD